MMYKAMMTMYKKNKRILMVSLIMMKPIKDPTNRAVLRDNRKNSVKLK